MAEFHYERYVLKFLAVAVAIGLIGFAGYTILHKNSSGPVTQTVGPSESQTSAQDLPANAVPTKGWKESCDTAAKLCFQYPADWTVSSDTAANANSVTVTATSKDQTARVIYVSNYQKDGGKVDVVPVYQEDHRKLVSEVSVAGTYRQVGGSFTDYYDVFPGMIDDNEYPNGEPTKDLDNPRFEIDGRTYKFSGWPLQSNNVKVFSSADQAKAWFDTADSKTIREIMHSLHRQE